MAVITAASPGPVHFLFHLWHRPPRSAVWWPYRSLLSPPCAPIGCSKPPAKLLLLLLLGALVKAGQTQIHSESRQRSSRAASLKGTVLQISLFPYFSRCSFQCTPQCLSFQEDISMTLQPNYIYTTYKIQLPASLRKFPHLCNLSRKQNKIK